MSDDTEARTPDEIRRSELIARVNEHNAPARWMNPYALGLGWIGFFALTLGLIILAVGAYNAQNVIPNDFGNDDNGIAELVVGGCFSVVGVMTLAILLAAQAINWQLRRGATETGSTGD